MDIIESLRIAWKSQVPEVSIAVMYFALNMLEKS